MSGKARPQISALVDAYRPHAVSDVAGLLAREAVGRAAPTSPARAKALLFAASRLAAFGERVGLELSVQALLDPAVIERFVLLGCEGFSPASVRTLRSNLRLLSRSLARYPEPAPVGLARERAKPPYSDAQIDGYLRLAAAQSTQARRMRARALVCLGAGAGIVAGELRHIRGADVVERDGGMLVRVGGCRARSVPVLERFTGPLLCAARYAGEALIVGGREPDRRNITDALTRALSAEPCLPRLQSGRLRSTWLCACAQRIGLGAFMQAAGISCSQRLGDLAARLPPACEQELVALLGAGP